MSDRVTIYDVQSKNYQKETNEERSKRMIEENKQEQVNHPVHYQGNEFEVIDIIEDYNLGFSLGNVIKYTLRAGRKGDKAEDLEKAIWYLQRELKNVRK